MGRKKGSKFPHTEETKNKISATKTGHKVSEETKAKISAAVINRKRTPEQIENLKIGALKRVLKQREIRQRNKKWQMEYVLVDGIETTILSNNMDKEKIYIQDGKII